MIQNYLLIALRTLRRRRGYAFINIAGLAVGMACCVLILLFVRDELGYDRHLPDAERLVRLQTAWGGVSLPSTNLPMLRAVEDAYPDLLVAPLLNWGGRVGYEPTDGTPVQFQEDDLFMAEPSFFELFGFEMIEGTADVLAEPYQVIMSESAARRYFGDAIRAFHGGRAGQRQRHGPTLPRWPPLRTFWSISPSMPNPWIDAVLAAKPLCLSRVTFTAAGSHPG